MCVFASAYLCVCSYVYMNVCILTFLFNYLVVVFSHNNMLFTALAVLLASIYEKQGWSMLALHLDTLNYIQIENTKVSQRVCFQPAKEGSNGYS